jgi:uncharacterized protein YlzI (FlbEa/FlbD family)
LRGNLFFDVKKPLEEGESFNIRVSDTIIGIRGTIGIVFEDGSVIILEGRVDLADASGGADAGEPGNGRDASVSVVAGNYAVRGADGYELRKVKEEDVPGFVLDEIAKSEDLERRVAAATDLDIDVLLERKTPGTAIRGSSFTGMLTYKGQENSYSYTADADGKFRFDIVSDFSVYMSLYNTNGKELEYTSGTDDGFNAMLQSGTTYIIKVSYKEDFPSVNAYSAKIGIPSPDVDVTGRSAFDGDITFIGEEDAFPYTADADGKFRFDIVSDFSVYMSLYNTNEKELEYTSGTNDGFNAMLQSGTTYIIKVSYKEAFPTVNAYTVKIGIPSPYVDVTGRSAFDGDITFIGEEDAFPYTAGADGKFRFDVVSDFSVYMSLYNQNGEELEYTSGTNDGFNAMLQSGTTYVIKVSYKENFPTVNAYTVKIGVPDPIVNVTGRSSFDGDITFIGEEDSFTYTAGGGNFRFDIVSNFSVYMSLYNQNGEELEYTSGTNDGFNATLQSGTTYVIKVSYKESFPNVNDYTVQIGRGEAETE